MLSPCILSATPSSTCRYLLLYFVVTKLLLLKITKSRIDTPQHSFLGRSQTGILSIILYINSTRNTFIPRRNLIALIFEENSVSNINGYTHRCFNNLKDDSIAVTL